MCMYTARKLCPSSQVFRVNLKQYIVFLDSLYWLNVKLSGPAVDIATEGTNSNDVADDEHRNNNVSAEVARQQEQIRFLQKTVEDQSRLLQEISHQLKEAAGPVDTSRGSFQETYL